MQDLMTRLPGSQSGQPMVAPGFNPQINKPQLATDVQVNKDIIKADKNQQLGLMLHALGGALKGDKNFVQNTMAIQTMQEGKKKKEERTKNYKEFLETLDPKSPFYSLAKTMGADKLDQLLMEKFKADTRQTPDASKQIKQEELRVIRKLETLNGDISQLSGYEKNIYDNYVKGGGNINPINQAIAQLLGQQNSSATPPPGGPKKYTVANDLYSGQSANDVIVSAVSSNPGLSREEVIKNLISQGIIAEG